MEIVSQAQKHKFTLLATIIIALQTLDGILTTIILSEGFGYEGMPFVSPIAGYWWFGLVKFGITAIALFILWKRLQGQEKNYRLANRVLVVVAAIFGLIVGWNAIILSLGVSMTSVPAAVYLIEIL